MGQDQTRQRPALTVHPRGIADVKPLTRVAAPLQPPVWGNAKSVARSRATCPGRRPRPDPHGSESRGGTEFLRPISFRLVSTPRSIRVISNSLPAATRSHFTLSGKTMAASIPVTPSSFTLKASTPRGRIRKPTGWSWDRNRELAATGRSHRPGIHALPASHLRSRRKSGLFILPPSKMALTRISLARWSRPTRRPDAASCSS